MERKGRGQEGEEVEHGGGASGRVGRERKLKNRDGDQIGMGELASYLNTPRHWSTHFQQ